MDVYLASEASLLICTMHNKAKLGFVPVQMYNPHQTGESHHANASCYLSAIPAAIHTA